MRQLKIIEYISLDGVIQAPGGKNDPAAGEAILAAYWPKARNGLLAGSLNTARPGPKVKLRNKTAPPECGYPTSTGSVLQKGTWE
jgi:hypothetical protein